MPNERLKEAMQVAGLTPEGLAEELEVDAKTVRRWISNGRVPYPRHRSAVATMLDETEEYLWPNIDTAERQARVSQSEVIRTYPRRFQVPPELWRRLFDNATERIGILVYSGLFLPEHDPGLIEALQQKAAAGTRITILLGDPDSEAVAVRGREEGIGDALAAKVRNVLSFYEKLRGTEGVFVGYHSTTLYNSIYRYDDEMLVNTHVYGFPAAHAPVLHLRRLAGGTLFNSYADSFDRVWTASRNAWGGDHGKVRP
ncbi:XRE family transcriptional regulator [Glycomyces albidus]|uniref:XRE family transcriptional regulator n=1 Tax=Glycomyces albidus TaxID=2656774 RepID=A0A6L5G6I7_9ACTN|nr:XRE family transcriptional regulator [Glycomyces albidus]MQM25250.1 XRE family transcriptional regulator [Glycomyces albidus]